MWRAHKIRDIFWIRKNRRKKRKIERIGSPYAWNWKSGVVNGGPKGGEKLGGVVDAILAG